jgi:uncharacterized protein YdaU (DUF1376 family)
VKKLPFYKMYPKDFDTNENVKLLDLRETGLYLLALNHAWVNGGLPANEADIGRALKISVRDFRASWPRVAKCFELSPDGRLRNRRQEEERTAAEAKSEQAEKAVRTRYENHTDVGANVGTESLRHTNSPNSGSSVCEGLPALARAESASVVSFSSKGVQGGILIDPREYQKTCAEIAGRFPTADMAMMSSIIHAAMQAFISVDKPKMLAPTDGDIAEAVRAASKEAGTKQTSAALYKTTVPAIVGNWAKFGKANGNHVKYWDPREVTG